jgi:amino acid transporter
MAAAVSIGIGGMVGAGIFSILGVVAHAAGNAMWLAFAIGGVVALLSTYSYAKLGATFPSAGGAVHFLVKGFGDGVFAGGVNLFMWAGYIVSLALYATAFGTYAATFVTHTPSALLLKSLAVAAVVVLTAVNAFGAKLMGRSETLIVAVKVAILVLFAAIGVWFIRPGYLSPELWPELHDDRRAGRYVAAELGKPSQVIRRDRRALGVELVDAHRIGEIAAELFQVGAHAP